MIVFRDVEINGPFRYLWLKYVTGVNLNVHCAACLKGPYSKKIGVDLYRECEIVLDEHPAKILYLCGVASPYKWENNFHLAMSRREGENFTVAEHGIILTVDNAVRIPITDKYVEAVGHPKRFQKAFYTCRNWQFANFAHYLALLRD